MSTIELKKKLIGKISATDDELLLQEIYKLLEIGDDLSNDYKLSDEQIKVIHQSQRDVKAGKFLTDDEADKDINKWLGK